MHLGWIRNDGLWGHVSISNYVCCHRDNFWHYIYDNIIWKYTAWLNTILDGLARMLLLFWHGIRYQFRCNKMAKSWRAHFRSNNRLFIRSCNKLSNSSVDCKKRKCRRNYNAHYYHYNNNDHFSLVLRLCSYYDLLHYWIICLFQGNCFTL